MQTLIEDKDFGDFVTSNSRVLVKFFATWCGPCRMVSAMIDDLQENGAVPESLEIAEVNVDNSAFLAGKYNITTLPTLILFEDGIEKERIVGFAPKQKILDLIA